MTVDGSAELQHAGGHHYCRLRVMDSNLRGEPQAIFARESDVTQGKGR